MTRVAAVFCLCHLDVSKILLVIWGHKEYYTMEIIGRIIVSCIRNDYDGTGDSLNNLAKNASTFARYGPFCSLLQEGELAKVL